MSETASAQTTDETSWTHRVYVLGETPWGTCRWCKSARSPAGCLNLCEMPAGAATEFTNGLLAVIASNRAKVHQIEVLGGCTCPAPKLWGYAVERDRHDARCPMETANVP